MCLQDDACYFTAQYYETFHLSIALLVFSLFSLGSVLDKILGSTVWNPTLLLRCKISEGYREKTCMQNRHIPVSSAKIKMWFPDVNTESSSGLVWLLVSTNLSSRQSVTSYGYALMEISCTFICYTKNICFAYAMGWICWFIRKGAMLLGLSAFLG